jgi:hypothetical protein
VSHKTYLGNGAYVEFDRFAIVLTTENGITTTNRIVLGPDVFQSLERWVANLRGEPETPAPGSET